MANKTNKVLVLRTCNSNMTSYSGFRWPKKGPVECKDWDSTPEYGHGLHGLLWGEGDGSLLNWNDDAKWLIVSVDEKKIVKIDNGKVKFPRGTVVFCGDRKGATDYLLAHGAEGRTVVGAYHIVGDQRTAVSGYKGTSTSGYMGISTSGYKGTSTSGYGGTSTSGYMGTSTSGHGGKARSGVDGRIEIAYWDDKATRTRKVIGYIGENGLKPDVFYQLNDNHEFVTA